MFFPTGLHLAKISIVNLSLVPVKWNCSIQESVKKSNRFNPALTKPSVQVITLFWLTHFLHWAVASPSPLSPLPWPPLLPDLLLMEAPGSVLGSLSLLSLIR